MLIFISLIRKWLSVLFRTGNPINDEYIAVDPLVLPERNVYYYQAKPVDIVVKNMICLSI